MQASDNMHSLLVLLVKQRRTETSHLVVWYAVLFTHCDFRVPATEWNDWEAIDRAALRGRSLAALLGGVLVHAREQLPGKARDGRPTPEECEEIAMALRPRFEVIRPRADARAEHESDIQRYTEEQYLALDGMSRAERVIFEGPAGTGKTVLALEAARRAAARGRRVGLLCFNRLLGAWLTQQARQINDQIEASTVHALMLVTAELRQAPSDAGPDFFADELPDLAIEALLESGARPRFDVLVVDEAQDLLRDKYLDFLDLICEGGLSGGQWILFGDFERQALYESDVSLNTFRGRQPEVPMFSLRTNCRNTPRVASWVTMLAGLSPPYTHVRRPDEGLPPRTRYYRDDADQQAELVRLLDFLYAEGFEGQDIVLLSSSLHGAASRLASPPWRDRLKPFTAASASGHVRYATVQAFKGLEAPVVVLTDVDEIQGERAQALFYTAATRPTERLYVLADEVIADQMFDLLDRFEPMGEAVER
jgi:superfamily I DNA/RNA helicase